MVCRATVPWTVIELSLWLTLGRCTFNVAEKIQSLAVDWSDGFHGAWCEHVACLLSVCHCLFSHCARQYLFKIGGQLDKRMLHWQPAKCCIFQLFIIICYLANKVLLLLTTILIIVIITSLAGGRHNMPRPLQVDLWPCNVNAAVSKADWWPWPLTLWPWKWCPSHVCVWATSLPILVFLGLSVLELGLMYVTDNLRPATADQLIVPRTRTAYGSRCFAVHGPVVWNSLPAELRSHDISLDVFRKQLKTFLFNCW